MRSLLLLARTTTSSARAAAAALLGLELLEASLSYLSGQESAGELRQYRQALRGTVTFSRSKSSMVVRLW